MPRLPRRLFVTHGTPEAAAALSAQLVAAVGCEVHIPSYGEVVEL